MNFINHHFFKQVGIWAGILGKDDIAADFWVKASCYEKAPARSLAKRFSDSEALLRRSLDLDSSQAPAWFNLGFLLQKRNQHEEAISAFDQAIRHQDNLDRAHYGRALSLMALDRNIEAKAALERTVDLQPMSPYGYYHLAHLQFRMGDEKAYRKTTRKLSSFEPKLAVQIQKETGVDAGVQDPFDRFK
jgi:tetratricopeptide (TPR) repeat protein